MTCFHPLEGRKYYDTILKKESVTLKQKLIREIQARPDLYYDHGTQKIPCGQCIGCRVEKSRQWALRCICELKYHPTASFITLTFDNEHLPENESISKVFIADWLKKLRERIRYKFEKEIRFYACGEYGDKLGRPHYHAIIFGFDFPDKQLLTRKNGQFLYISEFLRKAWDYGWHTIGQVTLDSCQYVAQYVHKKITNKKTQVVTDHYGDKEPEFHHMSRRPGLGAQWFDDYKEDCYPSDTFVYKGKVMRPPRYFDYLLKKHFPDVYADLKEKREERYLDSDWSKLSEAELEKELRRKEKFLHQAHKRHHRYLEEELANA